MRTVATFSINAERKLVIIHIESTAMPISLERFTSICAIRAGIPDSINASAMRRVPRKMPSTFQLMAFTINLRICPVDSALTRPYTITRRKAPIPAK